MRKEFSGIIVLAVCLLLVEGAWAQVNNPAQNLLPQVALFKRCYSDLSGVRPQKDNPLLLKVRQGTVSALDACFQILNKAALVPIDQATLNYQQKSQITPINPASAYVPYVLKDISDAESIAVLNKFYNFHRMIFDTRDLSNVPPGSILSDRFNDPTEPALFLTRVMFDSSLPYKEVVSANYAVRGIRSLGAWVRNYYNGGSAAVNLLSIPEAGLQRGTLWGIGAYAPGNRSWITDDGTVVNAFGVTSTPGAPIQFTFGAQRSYGGGIMGLHSYVYMNSGFPAPGYVDNPNSDPLEINSGRSNASRRMHRRWSQNVLSDFLCRPIPALRPEDVTTLVANYLAANPDQSKQLPFRASGACMACHASIDSMAATVRALYFFRGDAIKWLTPAEIVKPVPYQYIDPSIHFVTMKSLASNYTGIKPKETPAGNEYSMMSRDPQFSERPDSGDLRFRSYDGSLVWQHFDSNNELDGLRQLGASMAATNDLYVCAASRYFQYFTGIEVNLQDIGDLRNPTLSADDLHYRNVVIQLGLKLKTHQSLIQLVKDIMSLSLYQKQGLRDAQ